MKQLTSFFIVGIIMVFAFTGCFKDDPEPEIPGISISTMKTAQSISLEWTSSVDASEYVVYYAELGVVLEQDGKYENSGNTLMSHGFDGLKSETTYHIKVEGRDESGVVIESETLTITTL